MNPNGFFINAKHLLIVIMVVLAAGKAYSASDSSEEWRKMLEKWVETRKLASKEKQDWKTEKAIIEDRIQILRRETENLKESTAQLSGGIGEAEQKLIEATTAVAELKNATAGLASGIAGLEKRILDILKSSPAPIVERLKPLSQRIPIQGTESKISLSERFQNVVGIINEMNKFCREITITSEVRDQADGTKAEVTVVYLGLARAYYCNTSSGVAGIGKPSKDGWVWEERNDLAKQVADFIAINRNEKPAGYVLLPWGAE